MRRPRRAAVGVLSPWRAPKLGKIRRRACLRPIPLPGTGDVLLAPTQISHPLAYVAPTTRHNKSGRAGLNRQSSFELRRDIAQYRGAAHPLCFIDEVMDHKIPEGFKPVNIESYDGTTDPVVWIEDYLLHIHMARGDDLHATKYLPLKLKGPARHWLNSLPADSIGSWEDLEAAFFDNFQGTYVRPPDADGVSHIIQQPDESAR